MASNKLKKVVNIVLDVLLVLFFAVCLFALIATLSSRKNDGAMSIFGHQIRLVISPSMEKSDAVDVSQYKIKDIPVKSVVLIELVPQDDAKAEEWFDNLQVGDVLTFQYVFTDDKIVTHRIVEKRPNANGGYTVVLQGDNRDSTSNTGRQTIDTSQRETSSNYIIGKVTGVSYFWGVILFGLKQPLGIVLLVIIPCAIIVVVEIIKVINIFHGDKMVKAAEAEQKRVDEIEELKKQIAELQKGAAGASVESSERPPTDGNDE